MLDVIDVSRWHGIIDWKKVKASEEAMCKQDIASQERLATIEDALCELDAAVNK